MTATTPLAPSELKVNSARDRLTVAFANRDDVALSAEYLRVFSPSAEVQGHSADQKQTIGGKQTVQITKLMPVGNYAVRIVFDDMHDTGIYSWSHLAELADNYAVNWPRYLEELTAKGLKR